VIGASVGCGVGGLVTGALVGSLVGCGVTGASVGKGLGATVGTCATTTWQQLKSAIQTQRCGRTLDQFDFVVDCVVAVRRRGTIVELTLRLLSPIAAAVVVVAVCRIVPFAN